MRAFISYSHQDARLLTQLHTHLAALRRQGLIITWTDREIPAGGIIEEHISHHLEEAELYLLLVSPAFINSRYCYDREFSRALERHRAGYAIIVPIILRDCDWQLPELRQFKALPQDGHAVTSRVWRNRDEAFSNIVTSLRQLIASGPFSPLQNTGGTTAAEPLPLRQGKQRDDCETSQAQNEALRYLDELDESLANSRLLRAFGGISLDEVRRPLRFIRFEPTLNALERRIQEAMRIENASTDSRYQIAYVRSLELGEIRHGTDIDLNQIIAAHPRVLILGDPGSGKTEALKHLVRGSSKEIARRIRVKEAVGTENLPIFVTFAELAHAMNKQKVRADFSRIHRLQRKPSRHVVDDFSLSLLLAAATQMPSFDPLVTQFFKRWLTSPPSSLLSFPTLPIVCIDGWDELSQSQKEALKRPLELWSKSVSIRLVISSRLVGYEPLLLGSQEIAEFEMLPFTTREIDVFVRSFFSNYSNIAEGLLRDFKTKPMVQSVLQNPLLASLVCISYWPGRSGFVALVPPARRVDIYGQIVDGVLGQWEIVRKREPGEGWDVEGQASILRSVLRRLALHFFPAHVIRRETLRDFFHSALSRDGTVLSTVERRDLKEVLRAHRLPATPNGLIRLFAHVRPVLTPSDASGRAFLFLHLTLQEFFCAEEIGRQFATAEKNIFPSLVSGPLTLEQAVHELRSRVEWLEILTLVSGFLNSTEKEERWIHAILSDPPEQPGLRNDILSRAAEAVNECKTLGSNHPIVTDIQERIRANVWGVDRALAIVHKNTRDIGIARLLRAYACIDQEGASLFCQSLLKDAKTVTAKCAALERHVTFLDQSESSKQTLENIALLPDQPWPLRITAINCLLGAYGESDGNVTVIRHALRNASGPFRYFAGILLKTTLLDALDRWGLVRRIISDPDSSPPELENACDAVLPSSAQEREEAARLVLERYRHPSTNPLILPSLFRAFTELSDDTTYVRSFVESEFSHENRFVREEALQVALALLPHEALLRLVWRLLERESEPNLRKSAVITLHHRITKATDYDWESMERMFQNEKDDDVGASLVHAVTHIWGELKRSSIREYFSSAPGDRTRLAILESLRQFGAVEEDVALCLACLRREARGSNVYFAALAVISEVKGCQPELIELLRRDLLLLEEPQMTTLLLVAAAHPNGKAATDKVLLDLLGLADALIVSKILSALAKMNGSLELWGDVLRSFCDKTNDIERRKLVESVTLQKEDPKATNTRWHSYGGGVAILPLTDEETIRFADEEIVLLLSGFNTMGDKIYNYLKIPLRDVTELVIGVETGGNFDVREYGEVIAAGLGTPTPEVKSEIEAQYRMINFPKVHNSSGDPHSGTHTPGSDNPPGLGS